MKTTILSMLKIGFILLLCPTSVEAQQQVQFTQYMYNTMSVNPAYVGTGSRLEGHLIHRSQWVGLDGAPTTQNFGIQGAVNEKVGLGLNFTNDRIGPVNQCYLNGSASIKLKLSTSVKLAVGLNGGLDVLNIDWSKGNAQNVNDQTIQNNIRNRVRPLIGAGTYLYGDNWYFGFSSPNFIQKDTYSEQDQAVINSNIHWYFIGGYVFQLTDNVKFKPAVLGKLVQGAPLTVDLSANFLFNDTYTAGVAYRYNDAISLLLGMNIKKAFFIGYSYDITMTRLRKYNGGSHDIILKYTLFTQKQSARSPRFF